MNAPRPAFLSAVLLGLVALVASVALPRSAMPQGVHAGVADDFRPGDRIVMRVEGDSTLSDTFTVREGPALELPALGRVSLAGVRREDLEPYLTREIGKYLRRPVIHARALVRVGMLGELTKPGFYNLPTDAVLSDALTAAGGPTNNAKIEDARIDRAGATVVKRDSLRRAIAAGLTLRQVGVESGDDVVIPRGNDPEHVWRVIAILVTIPSALLAFTLFHR